MLELNGLTRLLLKKGQNTTITELKENYAKLNRFVHSEEERKRLEGIYNEAIKLIGPKSIPRSNDKKIGTVQQFKMMKNENNYFFSEYVQQLVKALKNSVYYISNAEEKKVGGRVLFSGILMYRTPFGIENYINAYRLEENKEKKLYTLLNLPSLDSWEYRRLVNEKIFSEENIKIANRNRGGYLGVIRQEKKEKYFFDIDEEQMAACLAYQERKRSINRRMGGR